MSGEQEVKQPEPAGPLVAETRAFWRDVGRGMVRGSLDTVDETARQIVAVAGILEGLYFHAIAYSDLRGQATVAEMAVYLVPVALLLVSLCAALLVFFPGRYRLNVHSSEAGKLLFDRVLARKMRWFRVAALFLALGLAGVFAAVWVYLGG